MGAPAKSLFRFLAASLLLIFMAVVLNFVVDPLQFFRTARFFPTMYSPDSRVQDAGLIRSQDFDAVFMGTSLAIHFRQSDIDRFFGVRSLKLAMTGSSSKEQSFVLKVALDHHPKTVIWQMDDWIFRDAPDIDSDIFLPTDLYRRNIRGITRYLLSGAMARESIWILTRSIKPIEPFVARLTTGVLFKFPISRVDDINVLRSDFDVSAAYNAKKAVASFEDIAGPSSSGSLAEGRSYEAMVQNFQHDAVDLIAKNPDVKFDIYFPPYSILQWVAMRNASPATLKTVYDFSAYISRQLAQFSNVSLYDFREAKETAHNLNNYADVVHHSPMVDLKVLSWLAERKYLVDRLAPTASLERLKAQVEAFRIDKIER